MSDMIWIGDSRLEVSEHDSFFGLDPEPAFVDIKLRITDADGNSIEISGSDLDWDELITSIQRAMAEKNARLEAETLEEEERQRIYDEHRAELEKLENEEP